jgi:heme oxygenase
VAIRGRYLYNAMSKGHLQALPGVIQSEVGIVPPRTVRGRLRAGTRNDHALIDAKLLRLDLAKSQDYELLLAVHAESLQALAGVWRAEDGKDFQAMLGFLQSDLATLGSAMRTDFIPACIPASLGAGLGVAYVVRGSRLGAAILRRNVPASMPTSYLDFEPTLPWRDFLNQLELLVGDPAGTQAAMLAARSTFAVFLAASNRVQGLGGVPS